MNMGLEKKVLPSKILWFKVEHNGHWDQYSRHYIRLVKDNTFSNTTFLMPNLKVGLYIYLKGWLAKSAFLNNNFLL